ncbi:caspase family protein [Labrys wisconsinensis]|uniref:Tetratricopeptide (TPR) repeat protein n=1 Tax=Labrys wisconsinensis TaxID=425677 RepID=A0ABU0JE37_9HYPH|nr:caspase family protein [Labrys wisconsinensis]MDQ0472540.1 tetratricopeptide (TPR) repeat protein [Labrys wisconsinensis]
MRPHLAAIMVLGLCACFGAAAPVMAKNLAVVVGNNAYQEVPPLQAAVDDARAMSDGLRRAGFTVELVENGTKRQISRALATVEGEIEPGDTVVFHYSGHGFEIDGQNWLLPVDVPAAREGESGLVKDESFNAADIIDRFRAKGAGTVVAILDACRNNPFARSGTRGLGGTRGLARMDAEGGVFIMFSAGSKQEALDKLSSDDPEKTSVFVRSFLPLLGRQDLSLIDMAKETQEKVRALARSVGHDQVPAYYDGIVGRVTLTGALPVARPEAPRPAASATPGRSAASEDIFWQSIQASSDPAMFEAYLAQVDAGAFTGTYKALAAIKLAALRPKPGASPPPPPAPTQEASLTPPQPVARPAAQGATSPEIEACDRAAADRRDPDKPAAIAGVELDMVTAQAAIAACSKAVVLAKPPRRAFYELANAYEKAGSADRAATFYDKAVALGHPLALYHEADRYLAGRGVARSGPMAMSLFLRAADAGFLPALVRVASMYANGQGADRDYRKAAGLYQLAVTAGEPSVYAEYGLLYLYGRGVARDKRKACELFTEGASHGDPAAAASLRSFCQPG